jgi:inner membrane protein
MLAVAVAGISGHQPALNDPIYLASVLGAQAPDFDIIAQLRGNMAYLRQHRSFSHSIPGITAWSLVIAVAMHMFQPHAATFGLFLWAFAGGLSHILIDYFNTHGVAILWPFRIERKSFPLLPVFDPVLLSLLLAQYAQKAPMAHIAFTSFLSLGLYIFGRYLLRQKATRFLIKQFSNQPPLRIWVMPSLKRLLFWDFVVETDCRYFNGRLAMLSPAMEIRAELPKQNHSCLTAEAKKTSLGAFFHWFTPFLYFEEQFDDQQVNIYDLRYYANKRFIHSGTIVFNTKATPYQAYIDALGRTTSITA